MAHRRPVLDETSLYDGMRNLATSYYDTVSQFNRVAEIPKQHFSFQKVKGMDWKHAVKKLLGEKAIEDLSESGKKMLSGVMRAGITGVTALADPESTIAGAVIGMLSDYVFDAASSAFELEPEETLEQGTWVYIDRGKEHNKMRFAEEMRAEVSMFGDDDEILQKDEARQLFSPGFFIAKIDKTDEAVVYAYDVEEPMHVPYSKVRKASTSDRLRWDNDVAMTEIRELFFLRKDMNNIPYCKFQIGDEVLVNGAKYVCIGGDAETLRLQSEDNKIIEVDPQAATAGPRDHWSSTAPNQFRTVAFTITVGDYVYRPLQAKDDPPTDRATGVLCVVSFYDGKSVEVRDAWTGATSSCLPNDLVKPPLKARKGLNYVQFEIFRKRAIKRMNTMNLKIVSHHPSGEDLCWGYEMTLPFVDTRVISDDRQQTAQATAMGMATPRVEHTQEALYDPADAEPKNTMTDGFWWVVGTAALLILIL